MGKDTLEGMEIIGALQEGLKGYNVTVVEISYPFTEFIVAKDGWYWHTGLPNTIGEEGIKESIRYIKWKYYEDIKKND